MGKSFLRMQGCLEFCDYCSNTNCFKGAVPEVEGQTVRAVSKESAAITESRLSQWHVMCMSYGGPTWVCFCTLSECVRFRDQRAQVPLTTSRELSPLGCTS